MLDYIIVGQGLAGSVLALTLLKEEKKIMVIDENQNTSSSKVAAGLYNPIVFKRLVKSWEADELLPFADNFYSGAEELLGQKFYFKKNIIKIFVDEEERKFWEKKRSEDDTYLLPPTEPQSNFLNSPYGWAEVKGSGNMDVFKFLSLVQKYLTINESYLIDRFEHKKLFIDDHIIKYKDLQSKRIIFCEGYKAKDNPLFQEHYFKLTKGELLTLKIPDLNISKVINKGVFVLPIGGNLYKVGATYEWNNLDEEITQKGKEELLDKLKKIIDQPFVVVKQEAGIRPTVKDRRPIIGMHPKYSNIGIFNGMGTKGVMLAPYFAKQFVDHIEKGEALNKEVDLKRFK